MRFGVLSFAIAPFERLRRRWRTFEALGYDSVWTSDDINIPGYADFESWALLGALGRETSRVRIGTLVSTIRIRHPAFLAAQVVSLDQITGGRAAVGIGAGEPEQNTALGESPWGSREALERLDEQAAILSVLLRGEPIAHDGRYYPTTVAAMPSPVTQPRPPLVVAAHGPLGLRAAARHADAWNCLGGQVYGAGPNPDLADRRSLAEAVRETRRLMERVDEACVSVGREPASLRRTVLVYRPEIEPFSSLDAFDAVVGAYADLDLDEICLYWPPIDQALADAVARSDEARFERIAAERIGGRRTG